MRSTRVGMLMVGLIGLAGTAFAPDGMRAQGKPLTVVPQVDYARYAGKWFEIARLPNRFEKKCAGDVTATYTPRPDGRITVTNRCRQADGSISEASGVARRVAGQPPSVLEVRFAPAFLTFLPMVWGDYHVIDLGPDYEYAVVGSPDRKYLWILARAPRMEPALYRSLVERARMQGFDVSTLIEPPQSGSSRPNAPQDRVPPGRDAHLYTGYSSGAAFIAIAALLPMPEAHSFFINSCGRCKLSNPGTLAR